MESPVIHLNNETPMDPTCSTALKMWWMQRALGTELDSLEVNGFKTYGCSCQESLSIFQVLTLELLSSALLKHVHMHVGCSDGSSKSRELLQIAVKREPKNVLVKINYNYTAANFMM